MIMLSQKTRDEVARVLSLVREEYALNNQHQLVQVFFMVDPNGEFSFISDSAADPDRIRDFMHAVLCTETENVSPGRFNIGDNDEQSH